MSYGPPSVSWTPELVNKLVAWRAERKSASQIATLIGPHCTRNAVIGKMHRMGLHRRARVEAVAAPIAAPIAKPVPAPAPAPVVVEAARFKVGDRVRMSAEGLRAGVYIKAPNRLGTVWSDARHNAVSRPVTLMHRKTNQCCFPVGRNAADLTTFCGDPKDGKSDYCAVHKTVMYPPRPKTPVKETNYV